MKVRILGTRAQIVAREVSHSRHSGILVDNQILLDLGEEEFMSKKIKCVFITHFHPDHAFFEYAEKYLDPKVPFRIYAPEKHNKVKGIKVIDANETVRVGGYKITAIPVIHSLKVKSLGYIIEKGQKRIFYSGDVAWVEKKHRNKLGKLDLVITEGSYFRKGGLLIRDKQSGNIFGHTGIPDLVKMFRPYTRQIVIVHLGTWFMKDVKTGNERIRNFGNKDLKVEAAYDGEVFEV